MKKHIIYITLGAIALAIDYFCFDNSLTPGILGAEIIGCYNGPGGRDTRTMGGGRDGGDPDGCLSVGIICIVMVLLIGIGFSKCSSNKPASQKANEAKVIKVEKDKEDAIETIIIYGY